METAPYEEFSRRLHQRVLGRRLPINGTIEVTHRCSLSCVHCYNNLPMGNREARLGELTYQEHCRVLDEITAAGCLWLLYTGGEIFARHDFLDIYTYAKQKGLLITLFTNGVLINQRIANYLAEWRPFSIEITLYAATRRTYEQVTGVAGSFDRCLRGIRLLTERNLPLRLKTMALTLNKHELEEMKRFAEGDLGLEFKYDAMVNPRADCSRGPLTVRLTPGEIVGLDLRDQKRAEEWKAFAGRFTGPATTVAPADRLYHCGGGTCTFAVDPSGMLRTCALAGTANFDLRQGNFETGWGDFLLEISDQKITRSTKCVNCRIKAMCGMCPANGELENGDAEEPVDFLCQVAHLRAHALRLPVPPHGDCEYCRGGSKYDELFQMARSLAESAE